MTDTAVFRRLDLFAGLEESALLRAVGELDAVVVPAGEEFDIAASGAVCGVVGGGRLALAFIAEEERERTIGMLDFSSSDPAMASIGTMMKKRPISIATASAVL